MSYVVLQGIWDFIQDGSAVSSSNITRVCYLLNALTIMPGATLAGRRCGCGANVQMEELDATSFDVFRSEAYEYRSNKLKRRTGAALV